MTDVHNVVLVHGGFVDGSGWQGVYEALTADGYRVAIVQNPTLSLEGDVASTRRVINGLDGPVVLRQPLIRRGGDHRSQQAREGCGPGVHRGLRPGQGRVGRRAARRLPGRRAAAADPAAPRRLPVLGPGQVSRVPRRRPARRGRAASWPTPRSPGAWTRSAERSARPPGGKNPSRYLLTTQDRMIPPPAQRAMAERTGAAITEVPASHSGVLFPTPGRRLAHQARHRLNTQFPSYVRCGSGATGAGTARAPPARSPPSPRRCYFPGDGTSGECQPRASIAGHPVPDPDWRGQCRPGVPGGRPARWSPAAGSTSRPGPP